jgi:hypothetical protein
MPKLTSVKPIALTQAQRLARKQELRDELAKLAERMRELEDDLTALLTRCDHTDPDGRCSVVGGRVKVCAHCGKTVSRGDKLWQ